ncbi:MAG: FMN-binding protein [Clostridia bacterium]|nr:FMN-binding protein [Clostridia bacterium]
MKNTEKTSRFYISTAIILLTICAAAALVLAGLNKLTADRIAENKAAEEKNAMLSLYPDAEDFVRVDYATGEVKSVYEVKKGGVTSAYVINTSTKGFSDNIEMSIGIDADGVLRGVKVVSTSETTGFSNEQKRNEYFAKYYGATSFIHVDAISGATKSSGAAARAIEAAFEAYNAVAKGEGR